MSVCSLNPPAKSKNDRFNRKVVETTFNHLEGMKNGQEEYHKIHTRDFPLPRGPSRRQLLPSARVTVPLIRSESCLDAMSLTEDWFKLEGLSGECKFLRIRRLYKLRRDSGMMLELLVKRSEDKGEVGCMNTGGVSSMELPAIHIEGLGEREACSPNKL
jgi:hypothetical protein